MNPYLSLNEECPLDQLCDWLPLYKTTGKYSGLSIVECKHCKLQALYPRPNQKELYGQDYYQGKADYTYIDERENKNSHRTFGKLESETFKSLYLGETF